MKEWNSFEKGDMPEEGEWYWICYKNVDSTGEVNIAYGTSVYQGDDEWTVHEPKKDDVESKDVLCWFLLPYYFTDDDCIDPTPNRYYWLIFKTGEDYNCYKDEDEYMESSDDLYTGLYTYDPDDYTWSSDNYYCDFENVLDEDVICRVELPLYEEHL